MNGIHGKSQYNPPEYAFSQQCVPLAAAIEAEKVYAWGM